MEARRVHGSFAAVDRRSLLGGVALSAIVTGKITGAAADLLPELGAVETIPLWPGMPPGGEGLELAARVEEHSPDPAKFHLRALSGIARPVLCRVAAPSPTGATLIIMPGGGYRELSIDTAFAAARRFAQAGIGAFVLIYRLPPEGWRDGTKVPLQDATRAMRLLRANAVRYALDRERIGLLGFSAGGHLAATLSVRADAEPYAPVDAADRESARPGFVALLYPVITMLPPFAHEASREMLLGAHPSPAERAAYSCERLVTHNTPPMFLAAAADDPDVPVDNTMKMFAALRGAGVAAEMHIFEQGGHGFGLGSPAQPLSAWPELLRKWMGTVTKL